MSERKDFHFQTSNQNVITVVLYIEVFERGSMCNDESGFEFKAMMIALGAIVAFRRCVVIGLFNNILAHKSNRREF